ncbi:hypothetical protein L798_00107 [Zootermopsis nevadensis]|uniref:Uncharacterized protein n=1 Tax=Zootermopsis nevadensis TaxID=136037 RepID=A0A067RKU8_ZOONE|nr:hypothetical protein L798_00107 [Zootermopsis nevadensis]
MGGVAPTSIALLHSTFYAAASRHGAFNRTWQLGNLIASG